MPWAPCSPHPVQAVLLSLSRPSPLFVRLAPITECLFLSCRVVSAHLNTSAACSFCFSGLKLIVQPAYPPAQQFSFRFPLGEYSPARVSHSYHVQSARAGARVALGLLGGLENRLSEEGLLNSEGLLGRDPDPQVWPSKVEDGARAPHHLHPHHCQNTDTFVLGNYGCWCSVTQVCLTLYDPMDCSTPGLPVLHHLPGLHRVGDAIQPSCPLSSPSPPAFNHSQHQGLF